jgi:hypothetical protein
LGRDAPLMGQTLQLSAGNIAVIGASGLRAEINTLDPSGQGLNRTPHVSWASRAWWWLLALPVLGLVAALFVYGQRVQKRRDAGAP